MIRHSLFVAMLVAVALMPGTVALAVDVTFPDANLEAVVRAKLGIPGPTVITDTDMATLTGSFYAAASSISNIQGLEYGINMDDLNLESNQISDISAVSGLTNLTTLHLGNNSISGISAVSGLTNLTSLILTSNQISDISAVSGLTNLTTLSLVENQISDISAVSGLTNLERLYLSYNSISGISAVSGLTNLTQLSLEQSNVNNVWDDNELSAVSGLTNLNFLLLADSYIRDISAISGLTNMSWLDLSHNYISDTSAISGLPNLNALYLQNNLLEILDFSGSDFSLLLEFDIDFNDITSVLLADATLTQSTFDVLMYGGSDSVSIGIAEDSLDTGRVLDLDMSRVDFAGISTLSGMYTMDYLETLLLADASNLAGADVVTLTAELASLNWLDVTGLWETFDAGSQSSLTSWDAIEGNTLVVVPEPATLSLLAVGGIALLRRRK